MKMILIFAMVLVSCCLWSAEVCLVQITKQGSTMACGEKHQEKISEVLGATAAKSLGEKITQGFQIVNVVATSDGTIHYTLVKN
jgi:hypothetical protein